MTATEGNAAMIDSRQTNGRFAKGNAGGPGRPPRRTEADYLAALCGAVPPDEWKAIVTRAVADAKEGDAKARDWLSRYLIGSPPPKLSDTETAVDDPHATAEERLATLQAIRERIEAQGDAARLETEQLESTWFLTSWASDGNGRHNGRAKRSGG